MAGVRSLERDARGDQTTPRRPRWWTQFALVGIVLWAYDAINNLNPVRHASALAHGVDILHFEARLHIEPERWLNRWLATHLTLGRLLSDYYDTAHFVVTIGVLVWIYWRHPAKYRRMRDALLLINVVGFIVFWAYPVAPPRMLTGLGFQDIVAITHAVGAWSTGALASQANEYAAMPSLHVAWALWCCAAVWSARRDIPSRFGAGAYVVVTALIVMATANHYFLDVVAGVATWGLAAAAAAWIDRRRQDAGGAFGSPFGGGFRAFVGVNGPRWRILGGLARARSESHDVQSR